MSIEVYSIGTQVTIDGDIPAVIRAVTIYSPAWVKYLCVWWDERVRREEWLTEAEFTVAEKSHSTVTFR